MISRGIYSTICIYVYMYMYIGHNDVMLFYFRLFELAGFDLALESEEI